MTWDDYKIDKWQKPISKFKLVTVECPVCKNYIYEDTSVVLLSYPPMKKYVCLTCNWIGIA